MVSTSPLPFSANILKFTIKEEILFVGYIIFQSDDKISVIDSSTHSFYPQINKLFAWCIKSSIIRNYLVVARGRGKTVGKKGEGSQKEQTCRCKISKSYGCNVQHDDYS